MLPTHKNENLILNEGARVATNFSHYMSMEIYKALKGFVGIKGYWTNNKRECLHDFPHFKSMGIFSGVQGQLTLQSLVESG